MISARNDTNNDRS